MPSPRKADSPWVVGPTDFVSAARRAVAEEVDEIARMEAGLRVRGELAQNFERARAVLVLIRLSRVYRLLRALGRWQWLERRINRALR